MAFEHEMTFEKTIVAQLGTLGGNGIIYWKAPFAFTLMHVQSVQSNAGSATLAVGNATNAGYYVAAHAMGVSGTPVVKDAGDWNATYISDTNPHIAADAVLKFTIDYDGAGGTPGVDPQISIAGLKG
jgi:hypothetical protein